MIAQKLVVQVFEGKKYEVVLGQGRVLNISAAKDQRGSNISVFTVALTDGTVITTTDAYVKVVIV